MYEIVCFPELLSTLNHLLFIYLFIYLFKFIIYFILFIFGCVGSSLLRGLSLAAAGGGYSLLR